jgi:hypothetical protein
MFRAAHGFLRARGRLVVLVGAGALGALGMFAPLAAARGTYDLRGSWQTSGSGTPLVIKITSMNLATGAFSGTSYNGVFKVKGVETGSHIRFTQSETGYTATDLATITAGGKKMSSGTWSDTHGSGGAWAATKISGPSTKKKVTHKKHKKHKKHVTKKKKH